MILFSDGSKGGREGRPPNDQNSFNFMQFWGKIWQNRMLAPPPGGLASPPWGNPGSATVVPCHNYLQGGKTKIFLKIIDGFLDYYHPQTKLQKGNVFTSVLPGILSTGECLPDTPWADTPSWADTPLGRHPLAHAPGQTPPQQMATAADGTHPTGMHSCYLLF